MNNMKTNLLEKAGDCNSSVIFVIGNTSADMDSVASSIFLAYILQKLNPSHVVIPVVNTDKVALEAKRDIVELLKSYSIDTGKLVYYSDVQFESYDDAQIYLVDHNELDSSQEHLKKQVVGIIDHHADTTDLKKLKLRVIKPAASAIALIYEIYKDVLTNEDVKYWGKLVLAPLYLDTDLFNTKLYNEKYFDADVKIRDEIHDTVPGLEKDYFHQLQEMKIASFKISESNLAALLSLDYKEYSVQEFRYGISVVMDDLYTLLQLYPYHKLQDILTNRAVANKLDMLFVFCYKFFDHDVEKRLLVFNSSKQQIDQFIQKLEHQIEVEICNLPFESKSYAHLRLVDNRISRKKLEPKIRKAISSLL